MVGCQAGKPVDMWWLKVIRLLKGLSLPLGSDQHTPRGTESPSAVSDQARRTPSLKLCI